MVSPGNIQDQAKEMGNQAKQYGRASQTLYERNKGLLWVVGAVAVMGYGREIRQKNASLRL